MSEQDQREHHGGCQCGALRVRVQGPPIKAVVCHCRYCQTRTGSAFGVSAYFHVENVSIEGEYSQYTFSTESGRQFHNRFCGRCGSTVFWSLELYPSQIGIAAGCFDPPSFWFALEREVFTRSKAPFVDLNLADSQLTSSSHQPCRLDALPLNGALGRAEDH